MAVFAFAVSSSAGPNGGARAAKETRPAWQITGAVKLGKNDINEIVQLIATGTLSKQGLAGSGRVVQQTAHNKSYRPE